MGLLFLLGAVFLEIGPELLIVVLLTAAAVAGAVARTQGDGWDAIQRSTGQKIADVLPALLILLAIGMLIAAWVLSGTIPFLVYWGIQLVSPRYLVLTAFLATAAMSLTTGTSWGPAGTIGVALMGTALALGAPIAATAGAVVSGAYFGDKLSPLSDSTNICAMGAGAPLYTHIRHMMYTAGPSFLLAALVYSFVAGADPTDGGTTVGAETLLVDLDRWFVLGWPTLLPPVVVVWGIVRRTPAALAMAMSTLVAAVIGVTIQGFEVMEAMQAVVAGFDVEMLGPGDVQTLATGGLESAGVGSAFATLVERGGLYSMANTLIVVFAAFLLAGAMDASGALELLIDRLLATARGVFGLIAATMTAGATMIALTSHGGVTALVIGGLFQDAYSERGLAPENLSRTLEDSVTITEPLMPWTVSAVFMATTLGVPTLAYAPWAVFCYAGPIFSLLIAGAYRRTGFGLAMHEAKSIRSQLPE